MNRTPQPASPTKNLPAPRKLPVTARLEQQLKGLALPGLAAVSLLLAVIAGAVATKLPVVIATLLIAGIIGLIIAFNRPDFVILAILILSSSIVDPTVIPTINVGFSFSVIEMAIMLLLGLIVLRVLTEKQPDSFIHTPLDWPVILFFVAATLSFFNAVFNLGTDRGLLVRIWRTIFNYLIFFAVTNHIRTPRQLRTLVGGMFAIAGVVAVLTVVQAVIGPSVKIIPSVEIVTASALDESFTNVARVIPPGTPLMGVMLVVGLIMFSSSNVKAWRRGLLFIFVLVALLAVLMTFSRSLWLGILLAIGLSLFWVRAWRQRKRVLLGIAIMVVMVIISTLIFRLYIPRVDEVVVAVDHRFATLFAGDKLTQDQQQRLCEVDSALVTIKANPVFGVGPGGYIHHCPMAHNYRFVHNSYLFIMATVGFAGFIPFAWFSLLYLGRAILYINRLDKWYLRSTLLGFSLAYVTMQVMGSAGGELLREHVVPVLGVMLGIGEVTIRLGLNRNPTTTKFNAT